MESNKKSFFTLTDLLLLQWENTSLVKNLRINPLPLSLSFLSLFLSLSTTYSLFLLSTLPFNFILSLSITPLFFFYLSIYLVRSSLPLFFPSPFYHFLVPVLSPVPLILFPIFGDLSFCLVDLLRVVLNEMILRILEIKRILR